MSIWKKVDHGRADQDSLKEVLVCFRGSAGWERMRTQDNFTFAGPKQVLTWSTEEDKQ